MNGYLAKPIRKRQMYEALKNMTSNDPEASPNTDRSKSQSIDVGSFDMEIALESVDGDKELLVEVIQVYLDECPRLLEQLHDAIEAKDFKGAQRAAHTIKGSSRIFGNVAIIAAARTMEERGRDESLDDCQEDYQRLDLIARHLLQELKLVAS